MNRFLLMVCLPVLLTGCKRKEGLPPAAAQGQTPAQTADSTLTGKVIERIDAPPYSYLQLDTRQGAVWAAVPLTDSAKGASVTVIEAFQMNGFESKTLNRTFDSIFFGRLEGQAAPAGQPAPAPHASPAPSAPANIKVEKAAGPEGRTVAEIHAQMAALKGKTVVIKGQVVKFNAQILGKNWVHIQDGSGSMEGGSNDLTLTTETTVAVGDVITVKGTLSLDKDFGSGYRYPVIVEGAKVTK